MVAAEIPYVAAKNCTMPQWFMKQNDNGAAINSLFVIYAVGIKYLGTAVILYAIGIFVYLKTR